ncbi:MAG: tetratricopeptide repeat protein [Chloroflexota bacterium]
MLSTTSCSFNEWLRQAREQKGITQQTLAELVSCSFSTICKIEAGVRKPSRSMAKCLVEVLGAPENEREALIALARVRTGINEAGGGFQAREATGATDSSAAIHAVDMPSPRTPFVGREKAIAAVIDLLDGNEVRLVTLTGPPGIGKTRLSMQVADRVNDTFTDGVVFVQLAALDKHHLVLRAIAQAFNLNPATTLPLIDVLKLFFREKHLLMVLDNFEHLIPAGRLLGDLLETCPGLKILVTSRTSLGIYGEHLFTVPSLSVPPAGQHVTAADAAHYEALLFFEQRSLAATGNFHLTDDNVTAVAEICRRLDGLPLAIELAAARGKALSPDDMLARLSHTLGLLTAGATDLPHRQQSLRGAIGWSCDLLDEAEQLVFRRMSVFVGGSSLQAIEQVCGSTYDDTVHLDVADIIDSLLNKSLLHRLDDGGGVALYYMLWTIREYAGEQLAASGEFAQIKRRHALYYVGLAERAAPYLLSGGRGLWLNKLDHSHDNLRDALTWCKESSESSMIECGLRLASALEWYWYYRGYINEGKYWLSDILAAAESAKYPVVNVYTAKALSSLGKFSLLYFDYEALRTHLSRAVEIWRALGDKVGLAYAMTNLGAGLAHDGNVPEGKALIQSAVELFREAGNSWGLGYGLYWLGDMYEAEEDWEAARELHEKSLRVYHELADSWGGAHNLPSLGYLAMRRRAYPQARAYYREALSVYEAVNDSWHIATVLRGLGDVELSEGCWDQAAAIYERSLSIYTALGDQLRTGGLLRNLGHAALRIGNYKTASIRFAESLDHIEQTSHGPSTLLCFVGIVALAVARGDFEDAACLSAIVAKGRNDLKVVMSAVDLADFDVDVRKAHLHLDEHTFLTAWSLGEQMRLDDAASFAQNYLIQSR